MGPTEQEAGWAPRQVWTLCRTENLSQLPGIERQSVAASSVHSGVSKVDVTTLKMSVDCLQSHTHTHT